MREMTLGQIAYEAHFGETAGDYALQSTRQQERWQRSADAVLAAAREREAGLQVLAATLRSTSSSMLTWIPPRPPPPKEGE